MRIVYVHRTQARAAEGAHIGGMLEAFSELGHTVSVICPAGAAQADADNGGSGGKLRTLMRKLYNYVSNQAPQVFFEFLELAYNLPVYIRLHLHCRRWGAELVYERYALNTFAASWVCRRLGIPHVLEVNDSVTIERSRGLWFRSIATTVERHCLQRATLIITISSQFKTALQSAFQIPSSSILVCPNGVSAKRFGAAVDSSAAKLYLGLAGRTVVGCAGQFVQWHGLTKFVRALAPIVRERGLVLLFVGDGPVRSEVLAAADAADIGGQVIFTGFVPHCEIPSYLAAFDIAVIPNSNVHGSPMKLTEFMAMGLPVLAPDLPPIREILVNDGELGCLFPRYDMDALGRKLAALLDDMENSFAIGRRARAFVLNHLTWQNHAENVLRQVKSRPN